jgi:adenylate cyclase
MPIIRKYKLKNVSYYVIIGSIVGAVIGLFLQYLDRENSILPVIRGFIIGFLVGTTIGLGEEFLFLDKFRRKTFLFLQLFRVMTYSAAFIFYELLLHTVINYHIMDKPFSEAVHIAFYRDYLVRDLLIITFISLIFIFFLQIRRLHNPGDLRKYVFGKYHLPEEIEKIFLFIDLKSSTETAERLGNLRYSSFLIDYYHDMTIGILMSKAEIYQYVGDEIILTWYLEEGLKNSRCINCFSDIKNTMELNKENYLQKYGIYPQFKAALHAGKVSVTWIGGIKKEIVYHGDVINTTSRILGECNKYNQTLIISEYLLEKVELPGYLISEFLAELQLKGRQEKIKLFGLKNITEV